MKKLLLFANLLLSTLHAIAASPQKGYVIVPIADMLGSPIAEQISIKSYQDIPLCGSKPTIATCCPRLHQALFNEEVHIIDSNAHEYCVEHRTAYYVVNNKPKCQYWLEKSAVKTVAQLKDEDSDLAAFPRSSRSADRYKKNDTVVLIQPWHDKVSNTTYSSGTRFLYTKKTHDKRHIIVALYDPKQKKVVQSQIPTQIALIDLPIPDSLKREAFIKLLRSWTENEHGYIPYVWGGTSFCERSNAGFIQELLCRQGKGTYFALADQQQTPKQGFDCSGLIGRAAEIIGIDYRCKNSLTARLTQRHLTKDDQVLPGDIIWFPGHVIIISDPERSLAIEARGYGVGFGKVHELPISKIFKNVKTVTNLKNMLGDSKKQITRIDREGNTKETHYDFAILSLTEKL